jgi:homoserine acetyltransferase
VRVSGTPISTTTTIPIATSATTSLIGAQWRKAGSQRIEHDQRRQHGQHPDRRRITVALGMG